MSDDEFEIHDAVRQAVRLRIMLIAPSGGGKTESALRLATGMCSVVGGKPALIDTQDQAAAWYAEKYKFGMMNFRPLHDGDRFLRAIQVAATKSKVIIVDTLSDEHEGEGGMLEQHDSVLRQLVLDKARRDGISPDDIDEKKLDGGAWREAKEGRKRLIRGLRFVDAHIIFTVRAKEASKIFAKKGRAVAGTAAQKNEDGWVAVTDDDFLFECPIRMMMLPMSNGVPCWDPVAESERKAIRRPGQFDTLLNHFKGKSLCEEMGEEMARWALGDAEPKQPVAPVQPQAPKAGEVLRDDIAAQIVAAESHVQLDAMAAGINAAVESKKFGAKTAEWLHAKLTTKRATLADGA
jgi:hypothetical protein